MDGGEHERSFFLGSDADTPSKLVALSVQELTGDFESVDIDIACAVDLATVVAPVNDEGLVRWRVVRMNFVTTTIRLTCPTGPAIQQVTVWVCWLIRGSNSTSSSPLVVT